MPLIKTFFKTYLIIHLKGIIEFFCTHFDTLNAKRKTNTLMTPVMSHGNRLPEECEYSYLKFNKKIFLYRE